MKIVNSSLLLAIIAASVLAAAGCGDDSSSGGSTSGSSGQTEEQITVGVALPDLTAFQGVYGLMYEGMEKAAERQGAKIELTTTTGTFSPEKYLNAIDDLVARGVKVVGFQALDEKFAQVITRLKERGVQVVQVGDQPIGDEVSAINTDTEGAVRAAMEHLHGALGDGAVIGMLDNPRADIVGLRVELAKRAAEELGMEVVGVLPVDCDVVTGANAAQDLMQAHPRANAIFAGCGQPGIGAVQAVQQSGSDVLVYSYDGSDEELRAVKAGRLAVTIRQRFDEIGEKSMEAMIAAAKGEPVQPVYGTGFDIVDGSNVDQFLT